MLTKAMYRLIINENPPSSGLPSCRKQLKCPAGLRPRPGGKFLRPRTGSDRKAFHHRIVTVDYSNVNQKIQNRWSLRNCRYTYSRWVPQFGWMRVDLNQRRLPATSCRRNRTLRFLRPAVAGQYKQQRGQRSKQQNQTVTGNLRQGSTFTGERLIWSCCIAKRETREPKSCTAFRGKASREKVLSPVLFLLPHLPW